MNCPECEAQLPDGSAFQRDAGLGPPDLRTLDCPYCGAPLEPLRWRHLLLFAVILAVALTARELIGPLLDWRVVAVLCVLALAHHVRELLRWRRRKRNNN
jgi:Flp pilus assembly protein TadB